MFRYPYVFLEIFFTRDASLRALGSRSEPYKGYFFTMWVVGFRALGAGRTISKALAGLLGLSQGRNRAVAGLSGRFWALVVKGFGARGFRFGTGILSTFGG